MRQLKYTNILLSLVSIIFFLGGAELCLRVKITPFYRDNYYIRYDGWVTSMLNQGRYIPDPITLFKINPRFSGYTHINHQGFRDTKDYTFHKAEGVYRIACIGDSVTFSVATEVQESYPKILEHILNDRNDKIKYEVLNFGIPGYTSYQGLKLLESYVLRYSLDLVIINFGWNDMWDIPQEVQEDKNQRMVPTFILRCSNILERLKFYQLLEKIINDVQMQFRKGSKELWRTRVSLEDYAKNYRKMVSLLKGKKLTV